MDATVTAPGASRRTPRETAWARYTKVKTVGAGGSGQVYLARGLAPVDAPLAVGGSNNKVEGSGEYDAASSPAPSPRLYVVKRVYVGSDGDDEAAHAAAMEVKVLQVVPPHANIVAFKDHYLDDEDYLNIVMEYCRHGDLERVVAPPPSSSTSPSSTTNDGVTLRDVVYLVFQLLCAVRHLHRHGVVHRDLKPGNVFLVPGSPSSHMPGADPLPDDGDANDPTLLDITSASDLSRVTLKVADFGISRIMRTGSYAHTVVGTPFYLAPEVVESRPYAAAADMWAVGCVAWELCCRRKLFAGGNMLAVVRAIAAAEVPPLPDQFAPLEPLVRALVLPNPDDRLTADAAIKRFFGATPVTIRARKVRESALQEAEEEEEAVADDDGAAAPARHKERRQREEEAVVEL